MASVYNDWRSTNWMGRLGQPAGLRRTMVTKGSASLSKTWADLLTPKKPKISGLPIPGKPPPPGLPVPPKPRARAMM